MKKLSLLNKKYVRFIYILFVFYANPAWSQITVDATPSFINNKRSDVSIPTYSLPKLDNNSLSEFYGNHETKPEVVAHLLDVDINLKKVGKQIVEGNRVFYLFSLYSEDAYALNFSFSNYFVPKGARLFVSNENGEIIGAFTDRNNKENGVLPITALNGDRIYLEYSEPSSNPSGILEISTVGHHFKRSVLKRSSQSCEIDVNCEEGADWQVHKRSVCRLFIGNVNCTGTLINNTGEDGMPYLLTANHCISTQEQASNTLVYFQDEKLECGGAEIAPLRSIAGATLVATAKDSSLDFSLIRLSQFPPEDYQPYYAGWDATGIPSGNNICMHHPNGDVKKISVTEGVLGTGSIPIGTSSDYYGKFLPQKHWYVETWDKGTTEGGSSGCGLFNSDKRLIGSFSGGMASCSNPHDEYFQKLSVSYSYYNDPEQQLKAWLDPINTGLLALNGYDPFQYEGNPISNIKYNDTMVLYSFDRKYNGYWTGKNSAKNTAVAEKFAGVRDHFVYGVKLKNVLQFADLNAINISIWEGADEPTKLIYTQRLSPSYFYDNDYISVLFNLPIKVESTFYVGLEYDEMNDADEKFAIYCARNRRSNINSAWVKMNGKWFPLSEAGLNTSLALEVYVAASKEEIDEESFVGSMQTVFVSENSYADHWSKELFESDTIQFFVESDKIINAINENEENWMASNELYSVLGAEFPTHGYSYVNAVKLGVVENTSQDSIVFNVQVASDEAIPSKYTMSATKYVPGYFQWTSLDRPLYVSDTAKISIELPTREFQDGFVVGLYPAENFNSSVLFENEWIPIENFGFNNNIALGIEVCYSKYYLGIDDKNYSYRIPNVEGKKVYSEGIELFGSIASEFIMIDFGNNVIANATIEVISSSGSILFEDKYSTGDGSSYYLDVMQFATGMYFVKVTYLDINKGFVFIRD